jgi:hypothetical protein
MKPLFYIMFKSFKNTILELKRKPLVLILYILILISVIGVVVAGFLMPSQSLSSEPVEVFSAIVTAILLLLFYTGLSKGLEKGASFFRMADVNLTFTAPISPKKILVYGFINQLYVNLILLAFISFQIPNFKNFFAIKSYGIAIIYMSIFLMVLTIQIAGILLYSLASRWPTLRTWVKRVLNGILIVFLAGYVINLLAVKDVLKAGINFMSAEFFDYVPILGWIRVMLVAGISGVNNEFWINLSFIAVSLTVMVIILYKVNTDYYEDVLAATERKEEMVRAAKERRSGTGFENSRTRKIKQGYRGSGASAIFYRQILEYRKTGFLFLNKNTLFIGVIGLSSKFFFPGATIKTVLYFSIYILFFFILQNKWTQELDKPYIYLIPARSDSKVFYATLPDNIKNMVDGTVLFIIAGIMFKSDVLTIVLSILAYTSFGAIYIYGDVLARRLLGSVHSKNLVVFIKMFLIFFVIMPGLGISIALEVIFDQVPLIGYYTIFILVVYNLFASGIILLLNRGIFDTIEMK